MVSTDVRIAADKPVTPAFILAALLWPVVDNAFQRRTAGDEPPMVAIHAAGQDAISAAAQHLSIPRRFSQPMREIWEFQLRLQRKTGRKAVELIEHRRFRAAYDFLLLREQAGDETDGLGQWWTEVQTLSHAEREEKMASKGRRNRPVRNRTRRPKHTE